MNSTVGSFFWRQPISAGIVVAALALTALNLFDVFSTLYVFSFLYVEEANPLMRKFLAQGPLSFFVVKYLLAAFGGIFLALSCRQHRWARLALVYVLLPMYCLVATYQIVLLNMVK